MAMYWLPWLPLMKHYVNHKPLPESYSNVPSAVLIEKEPTIPETDIDLLENPTEEAEVKEDFCWLRHV